MCVLGPDHAFPRQLIDDKKALGERCEALVAELQQVDQKYTKKISQMEEQHQLVSALHQHSAPALCTALHRFKPVTTHQSR